MLLLRKKMRKQPIFGRVWVFGWPIPVKAIRMMSTDEFGGNQLKLQATKHAHTPKRNEQTTKMAHKQTV